MPRERQWEGQESSITKARKETFGVMNMFIFCTTVMVSLVHAYVKTCQIVPFKHVQFIFCMLIIPQKAILKLLKVQVNTKKWRFMNKSDGIISILFMRKFRVTYQVNRKLL